MSSVNRGKGAADESGTSPMEVKATEVGGLGRGLTSQLEEMIGEIMERKLGDIMRRVAVVRSLEPGFRRGEGDEEDAREEPLNLSLRQEREEEDRCRLEGAEEQRSTGRSRPESSRHPHGHNGGVGPDEKDKEWRAQGASESSKRLRISGGQVGPARLGGVRGGERKEGGAGLRGCHSPFAYWISNASIPSRLQVPQMEPYSGKGDPDRHLEQIKQTLIATAVPDEFMEVMLCRTLTASLRGPALGWFTKLEPYSIQSWSDLVYQFQEHFALQRMSRKVTADLQAVTQMEGEPLEAFLERFVGEMAQIEDPHEETAPEPYLGITHA